MVVNCIVDCILSQRSFAKYFSVNWRILVVEVYQSTFQKTCRLFKTHLTFQSVGIGRTTIYREGSIAVWDEAFVAGDYDEGQTFAIEIIQPVRKSDGFNEHGEGGRKCGRPDCDRFTVKDPSNGVIHVRILIGQR